MHVLEPPLIVSLFCSIRHASPLCSFAAGATTRPLPINRKRDARNQRQLGRAHRYPPASNHTRRGGPRPRGPHVGGDSWLASRAAHNKGVITFWQLRDTL